METSRPNVRQHEPVQTFRCVCVCERVGLLLVDHSGVKPDRSPDSVMDVSVCASVTAAHGKLRVRTCVLSGGGDGWLEIGKERLFQFSLFYTGPDRIFLNS